MLQTQQSQHASSQLRDQLEANDCDVPLPPKRAPRPPPPSCPPPDLPFESEDMKTINCNKFADNGADTFDSVDSGVSVNSNDSSNERTADERETATPGNAGTIASDGSSPIVVGTKVQISTDCRTNTEQNARNAISASHVSISSIDRSEEAVRDCQVEGSEKSDRSLDSIGCDKRGADAVHEQNERSQAIDVGDENCSFPVVTTRRVNEQQTCAEQANFEIEHRDENNLHLRLSTADSRVAQMCRSNELQIVDTVSREEVPSPVSASTAVEHVLVVDEDDDDEDDHTSSAADQNLEQSILVKTKIKDDFSVIQVESTSVNMSSATPSVLPESDAGSGSDSAVDSTSEIPRKPLKGLLKKNSLDAPSEKKRVKFSETMMVFCDDWPEEFMPQIIALKSPTDFNLIEVATQGYMFEPPIEYQDLLPFDPPPDYRDCTSNNVSVRSMRSFESDETINYIDEETNDGYSNEQMRLAENEATTSSGLSWKNMLLDDNELLEEDTIIGVLKEDDILQAIGSHASDVDTVFNPLCEDGTHESMENANANTGGEPLTVKITNPGDRNSLASETSETYSEADELSSSPTGSLQDIASDSSFTSQDTIILMTNAIANDQCDREAEREQKHKISSSDAMSFCTNNEIDVQVDSEAESTDTVREVQCDLESRDERKDVTADEAIANKTLKCNNESSEGDRCDVQSSKNVNSEEHLNTATNQNLPEPQSSTANANDEISKENKIAVASISVSEIRKAFERQLIVENSGNHCSGTTRPKSFPCFSNSKELQMENLQISNETFLSEKRMFAATEERSANDLNKQYLPDSSKFPQNWPKEDLIIEYTSEPKALVPTKRTSSFSSFPSTTQNASSRVPPEPAPRHIQYNPCLNVNQTAGNAHSPQLVSKVPPPPYEHHKHFHHTLFHHSHQVFYTQTIHPHSAHTQQMQQPSPQQKHYHHICPQASPRTAAPQQSPVVQQRLSQYPPPQRQIIVIPPQQMQQLRYHLQHRQPTPETVVNVAGGQLKPQPVPHSSPVSSSNSRVYQRSLPKNQQLSKETHFPNPSEIRRRDGLNAYPHVWEEPPKPGELPVPPVEPSKLNQTSKDNTKDELELFVQQDQERIDRIKKRYSLAEDDDPTFGFGKRPTVRGIKPKNEPHVKPATTLSSQLTPEQQAHIIQHHSHHHQRHVYLIPQQGGPQYQQRLAQVGATLPRPHQQQQLIQQQLRQMHLQQQQKQQQYEQQSGQIQRPASSLGQTSQLRAVPADDGLMVHIFQPQNVNVTAKQCNPLQPSSLQYKTISMPNVALIKPSSQVLMVIPTTKDERGTPEGASSSPKHSSDSVYCPFNSKSTAGDNKGGSSSSSMNNNPDLVKDATRAASSSKVIKAQHSTTVQSMGSEAAKNMVKTVSGNKEGVIFYSMNV